MHKERRIVEESLLLDFMYVYVCVCRSSFHLLQGILGWFKRGEDSKGECEGEENTDGMSSLGQW